MKIQGQFFWGSREPTCVLHTSAMELPPNEFTKPCIYVAYNSITPRKGGDGGADLGKKPKTTCQSYPDWLVKSLKALVDRLVDR
jgi:hypothetical protein